jgi:hypothetical protein
LLILSPVFLAILAAIDVYVTSQNALGNAANV